MSSKLNFHDLNGQSGNLVACNPNINNDPYFNRTLSGTDRMGLAKYGRVCKEQYEWAKV